MKTVPPTTIEGIERYLGSGLVIDAAALRNRERELLNALA
jgi:hypothetical protein